MKNMSIVPCIHTYANEKHEYSAMYTYLMQKNMSIVPCIHTYCNDEHEYSDCIHA